MPEPAVPHLLLVCPRSDILGKLLGLPIALTVVHRPGGDRPLEESLALRVVDVDFTDAALLLAAAREIHAWRPIDAILGLTELSLLPVSTVAQEMGVRGNVTATLTYAQDKAALRGLLAERGISTTAHRVCDGIEAAADFLRGCPAGMVLKPVSGNGGTGVHLVGDPGDLAAAWAWTTGASGAWGWTADAAPVVVLAEEFLAGREFSVETLSAEGKHTVLAVTGKHTSGPPHFVELGHELPAVLEPPVYETLTAAALGALDAIGYTWGPGHTEVMLAEDGCSATVVEINARQGGDQIWELVELATGLDMLSGSVTTLAFGQLPPSSPAPRRGAAIRYLVADPGRVVAVEGLDEASAVDGVIRVGELCAAGDTVSPLGDSWNRCGYVVTAAADTASAQAAARQAASLISIRTVPVTPEAADAGQ
ncbi:Biotin carboxylase [Streptomyces sp. DvalAA-14]|uniref:ATP-grasp domain-containing protein n=1 Tax=unclassified Streptomyces TaxID=2593676 RepID=UPI00081B48B0|nr:MULTISPECIES: ATP-grasp domain-containing protein [unclassified Streptomyces]MYS19376.1 ATP-grasp domain-containing protein [Streptomyces sp. SID4948]SCD43115.1 Biotin carboxylase [Streptomyces sp. DvalAA-14]